MRADKCSTKGCRNEPEMTYLGKPLCEECWSEKCEEEE